MAWHQKGFTKKEQAFADLLIAKGMLEIVNLQKGDMRAKDALKIIGDALEKVATSVDFLEENQDDPNPSSGVVD